MNLWRSVLDSMCHDPVPGAYRVLGIAILIVIVLFAFAGCAQSATVPSSGVCAFYPLGTSGEGILYVQYECLESM